MSWSVQAAGKRISALRFCADQKWFIENAPIGVQTALRELANYFPDEAIVSIKCSGHINDNGGNISIEIQNIPTWVE